MMPRPVLKESFHLTYRKIPVLAIGNEVSVAPSMACSAIMLSPSLQVYCDTSLIIEVLEHAFSKGHPSIYPPAADGKTNRAFIRGFASFWTDVSACISPFPNVKLTITATILPCNDRPDSVQCLAYPFRHRPCRINRPQSQSRQTRSKSTSKSVWSRLAPGMRALLPPPNVPPI
jgi:hypothetical protein